MQQVSLIFHESRSFTNTGKSTQIALITNSTNRLLQSSASLQIPNQTGLAKFHQEINSVLRSFLMLQQPNLLPPLAQTNQPTNQPPARTPTPSISISQIYPSHQDQDEKIISLRTTEAIAKASP